jgi:CheY-like chemotaxis protein
MPHCSGLELLETLESNKIVLPPTILCTAKGLELDTRKIASRYNLVAVMHKPFSPRKLSKLVLQHVALNVSRVDQDEVPPILDHLKAVT